jgi:hypothetical protein
MQHMERVMTTVRETNHWMEQNRAQAGLVTMGRELEGAGDRVRLMLREMDRVCRDPELERRHDRLRDMDRLHDRVQLLIRELDQTRETLRDVAQAP